MKMDAGLWWTRTPLTSRKNSGGCRLPCPDARVTVHGFKHPSKTDGDLPVCRTVVSALEKVYTDKVALSLGLGEACRATCGPIFSAFPPWEFLRQPGQRGHARTRTSAWTSCRGGPCLGPDTARHEIDPFRGMRGEVPPSFSGGCRIGAFKTRKKPLIAEAGINDPDNEETGAAVSVRP